jgi:hypothetical protein
LIELKLPEAAVVLDPLRRFAHRRGDQRRAPYAPLAPHARETGALEHTYVLRHGGERHLKARCQLADRPLAGRKPRDDRAPSRIGESGECIVERLLVVNHMV